MSKPKLTVTSDFTDKFNEIVSKYKHDAVLVGIPEEETKREAKGEEKSQINNATLLAINNFGSPVNNIPARPVMKLGIQKAADEIAEQFKKAAIDSLTQGYSAVDKYYNRAGIIASNSIKKVINSQDGFKGPSDGTITARKAKGFKGTKSLIVTGQMRNAITYVVKG